MQFVGFLLLVASIALAILVYKIIGVAGLVAATIIFIEVCSYLYFQGLSIDKKLKK